MRVNFGNIWSRRLLAVGSAAIIGLTGAVVTGPGVAAAGGGRPSPGAPGLGDRLYPLLGNGGYDVRNYDLSLTYPAKDPAQTVRGAVTVSAVATQRLSRFNLDFGGDAVGAVAVNGRPAAFARSGDELVVTPRRALARHRRFTVSVSFTATPVRPDSSTPNGFLRTPDGTVLAGQPNNSHRLFPSNDHPRDLATYTIRLNAPAGWTGTASGRHVRTRAHGGRVASTTRESHPKASCSRWWSATSWCAAGRGSTASRCATWRRAGSPARCCRRRPTSPTRWPGWRACWAATRSTPTAR
jgi:hypothetical protein